MPVRLRGIRRGSGGLVIVAVHTVVLVEFLVALCFTWWTTAPDNQFEAAGDHAGWAMIVSGGGYAQSASLGMVVCVVGLAVGRAVPLLIAAALAASLTVVNWIVLEHNRSIGFGSPHTAAFVGLVLVGSAAALNAGNAVLVVRGRRRRQMDELGRAYP